MSKRGGTSEVNGFISLRSDEKRTSKRRDENTPKTENDEKLRRKRDSSKDLSQKKPQDRTRLSEGVSRTESTKPGEKKDVKNSSRPKLKSESTLSKRTAEIKKPPLKEASSPLVKSRKPVLSNDKSGTSGLAARTRTDVVKAKDSLSSPYLTNRSSKPKTVQSTPNLKKQSSISKDSPYKSSVAQNMPRTSIQASGDRIRKTSQLAEKPSKLKTSSSKTASKTSKPSLPDSSKHKKQSDSSLKLKTDKKSKRAVESVLEDSDAQKQLKPFGEIPRSNTFTKDNGPESLTSDLSLSQSQSQELESIGSSGQPDDEYKYDDDFEDYESDFEEYMESEDSSETEESESSSDPGTLEDEDEDEDEVGDAYKAGISNSTVSPSDYEKSDNKSILKQSSQARELSGSNKENQNDKDKPLTVEEERKLDSGSYDLTSIADSRRKKHIQDIRAAIEKENASVHTQKTRVYAEDEGFVEVFSQESSPTFLENCKSPTDGLIDFASARKEHLKQKAKDKVKKRGAILMEMIKLDVMSFNHLDIPSVPYEVYMQCYGRSNTLQIYTQTNEDAIHEEVQTEEVVTSTKWTQHPVKYSSPKSADDLLLTFAQEKLGVGGESTVIDDEDWLPKLHVNSLRLHNFINKASEVILTLLEETEQDHSLEVSSSMKQDFGFSDSFFSLNVGSLEFLKSRPVSFVCFSESNSSHVLTVHRPSTEPLTVQAESEGRCMLCVWSVREPRSPRQTLVASNQATSVCFHSHLVFAGLVDGAICLWDLREPSALHCRSSLKHPPWILRSPTYITAELERDKRDFSSVVSINFLPESNVDDSTKTSTEQTPTQVVTLDEEGLLIVWTVVETKTSVNVDSGLAPWGRVRLIHSSQLKVHKAFPKSIVGAMQCQCLCVDRLRPSNLYVGTNTGQVLHCLQSSVRTKPQLYSPASETNTGITCIDFSKCGHHLFMVGDTNGRIQIYRTKTEKPLLDIAASSTPEGPPVRAVQWSATRPGLFFVLDEKSSVHVWDLCVSDMCPRMTVPFPQSITSISLNAHPTVGFLAIASESGAVDIFNLKPEFCALSKKESEEENNIFSRYITIL